MAGMYVAPSSGDSLQQLSLRGSRMVSWAALVTSISIETETALER
jgi:hypothetical protein